MNPASTSLVPPPFALTCAPVDLLGASLPLVAMPESKTPPPLDDEPASVGDDPAPDSALRPSFPPADAAFSATTAPANDDDAPVAVTRELLSAFLAKEAAQDRIRQVVAAQLKDEATEANVDEVAQEVNIRAVTTTALPRTVESMRPWLSRVAVNATMDWFRARGREAKRIDRSIPLDDVLQDEAFPMATLDPVGLPYVEPEVEVEDEPVTPFGIAGWLKEKATSKADRLTIEMVLWKARSKSSNARVAAEFGMTEAAYDNRLLRFKNKWVPLYKRERARRRTIALIILGVLVLLAALALAKAVWPRSRAAAPPSGEHPAVPSALPAPSTTSAVPAPTFNPALPPLRPPDGKQP